MKKRNFLVTASLLIVVTVCGGATLPFDDDPGSGTILALWSITNPAEGSSFADTADIDTNGTKPSDPEGKIDLASDPGMTMHKTQLIGAGGTTWSHTFVPTPKWSTFGKDVGQQHPYFLRLFEKLGNGTYEQKHIKKIYITRT